MKLPVRLLSIAEADLAQQADYLQRCSAQLAIRFLESFDATLASISVFPLSGAPRKSLHPLHSELRSCSIRGFPNHLIFYRALEQEVVILRIVHGARDLDALFGPEGDE